MARRGDSARDYQDDDPNQTGDQNPNQTGAQNPNQTGVGVPPPTPSPGMPAYDPNNPNTWVEPTQPGGTGASAASKDPGAYGLQTEPGGYSGLAPSPLPPAAGSFQPGAGGQGGYGGFNNIPGLFGQIFGGLPGGPNTQIDVSQFQNPSPYEQALRDSIMNAIREGGSPVTADDPTIAPLIQSLQGQGQRAMEANQRSVGERMYAQGLPVSGGGYDARVQGYNQLTNEATQGQVAQTMLSQLNDRRNRLMTALNIGSNYLNSEQSRILQAELANVSNAMALYGMRLNASQGILAQLLQNSQYYSGLGTQANEFAAGQNAGATAGLTGQ